MQGYEVKFWPQSALGETFKDETKAKTAGPFISRMYAEEFAAGLAQNMALLGLEINPVEIKKPEAS